jgi:glycosyltransferase involved in cell wall biosynthesis
LNLESNIIFHGFVQTEQVAKLLGTTLALVLPSIEEQFGNVVIEAQALGLPVLLSDVCGARDNLVRTAVNGFIFEPDNSQGLAWFMSLIAKDLELWKGMSKSANKFSSKGDVLNFANAVKNLIGINE